MPTESRRTLIVLAAAHLAGCVATDAPTSLSADEGHPYGLDPAVCVEGVVGVGDVPEAVAYRLTVQELLPFRCFADTLQIRGDELPDLALDNLEDVGFLTVQAGLPTTLALPRARSALHLWLHGPVHIADLGGLDALTTLNLRAPGPGADLSALRGITTIEEVWLDGSWATYDGLTIPNTRLYLSGATGSLQGLERLVEGSVAVFGSSLDSLEGLRNVRRLDELALIASDVASLRGLERLGSVSGTVTLAELDDLTTFSSLSGLVWTGDLEVSSVRELTALELPALDTVDGTLVIEDNPVLGHLDLPALESLAGDLVVRDNPLLPACEVDRLAARLQASGFIGTVTNVGNAMTAACP